jgi:PIN domain nuclease of toxin-antitoxin system
MKILLDSHAALWFADDAPQMPASIKDIIEDKANEKYVSLATVWELAIKFATGKLAFADPPEIYLADMLRLNNFELLPLNFAHVVRGAALPLHHRDPFDRVIIAQSLIEMIPVISADTIFDS